jgi:hypothetical protein
MCLRTNKRLFASGFAMQAMVFLCATNISHQINILNGREGQPIEESKLKFVKKDPDAIHAWDYLLDNVTGDLFKFNKYELKWEVFGNCGIHKHYKAQTHAKRGKFVINLKQYRIRVMDHKPYLTNDRLDCFEVSLRKSFFSHWALKGVDQSFKARKSSHWDVHSFTYMNPRKTLDVMGDSPRAPCIFIRRLRENQVSTLFNIQKEVPNSARMMRNFLGRVYE